MPTAYKGVLTMNMSKRVTALVSALALTALCAGAAMAANGDKNDPLVTLSYLEKTALPEVVEAVEAKSTARQAELENALADQIAQYKQEVQSLVSSAGGSTGSASYTLVTLNRGQTMYLDVGCELMIRVGSAQVNSNTNPALIDIATGGSANNGTSLTKNHLYMATIPDRTLTPTADTVKLLVRGGYTVV